MFSDSQGDLDFQLLNSSGALLSSGTSTTDNEYVQAGNLANGTYYLRVYGVSYPIAGGGVEYELQWDDLRQSPTFDIEANNTRQTAEDIRFNEGTLLTDGIIVSNDDWFEIEVNTGSNSSVSASIFFDHDLGDLDLELVDSFGNVLDSSRSTNDNETEEASGLANGTYYLRVSSFPSQILGNSYDLQWDDFPESTAVLDVPFYRFRNTGLEASTGTSTYIYVDDAERQAIFANPNFNNNFVQEGVAFGASDEPGNGLVGIHRYRNTTTSTGTYVFATPTDFQNDPNLDQRDFVEENNGNPVFYAYPAGSAPAPGIADFTRFENNSLTDTFIYAGPTESQSIRDNFSGGFTEQGADWAVAV